MKVEIEGQDVLYRGKDTHIERVSGDGTCMIANPDWNWDEEAMCVRDGVEYCVPYWITVKVSELSAPNPQKLATLKHS
jgi:hypothetical protein